MLLPRLRLGRQLRLQVGDLPQQLANLGLQLRDGALLGLSVRRRLRPQLRQELCRVVLEWMAKDGRMV